MLPLLDANGLVVNVVVAGEGWTPPDGLTIGPAGGRVGDTWDGVSYQKQAPPQEQLTQSDYANAIQNHIDAVAQSKGYADAVALASYLSSSIPAWQAEAQTFVPWRDQVWLYAYAELAKVQSGQRPIPTLDGIISELPIIGWPNAPGA